MVSQNELIQIEGVLWAVVKPTGLPIYDFDFGRFFTCRHPSTLHGPITAVGRMGAFEDYCQACRQFAGEGITLIHSPDEYSRASELPNWYRLLEDLTPRSVWFSEAPDVADVASALAWPVFVKGERQTSRHKRALSIIEGPDEFERAMEVFREDPIMKWQKIVCREFVSLRAVEDAVPGRIPSSFEFRTFWWRQELVGLGRYWWEGKPYEMTEDERREAVAVAREASRRIDVHFLVVDVAQTADGRWIVIEVNDGQESGYAGVWPFAMWQNVIEIEKSRLDGETTRRGVSLNG